MNQGWTSKDTKQFSDLLVKANDEQLQMSIRAIKNEINMRFGRAWAEADNDDTE